MRTTPRAGEREARPRRAPATRLQGEDLWACRVRAGLAPTPVPVLLGEDLASDARAAMQRVRVLAGAGKRGPLPRRAPAARCDAREDLRSPRVCPRVRPAHDASMVGGLRGSSTPSFPGRRGGAASAASTGRRPTSAAAGADCRRCAGTPRRARLGAPPRGTCAGTSCGSVTRRRGGAGGSRSVGPASTLTA
jgi:hypothetical protein